MDGVRAPLMASKVAVRYNTIRNILGEIRRVVEFLTAQRGMS